MKPTIDPVVLKLAMWLSGGVLVALAAFMPPGLSVDVPGVGTVDARAAVALAGVGLVAWAKRAPGDLPAGGK